MNSFSSNKYDLGIGSTFGLDRNGVSETLLRTAYDNSTKCYVCKYGQPKYQVLAKKDKYITAEIQNGLYLCKHCISLHPVNSRQYIIKDLG